MKQLFIIVAFLAISKLSTANQIVAVAIDKWSKPQTWNLNRIPADGDTIVIPFGITVTLDYSATLNNIKLLVYGGVRLNNGKLTLNTISEVTLQLGGIIQGFGNNDQLKIGGIFKYRGSQGLITGPSVANSSTGVAPNGFLAFEILPVKFNSFSVNASSNRVVVRWSTSQEVNNSHFEVERSSNGQQWHKVAVVFAQENSAQIQHYQYIDKTNPASVIYYRIRQVDVDGRAQYSDVRTLKAQSSAKATIYASAKRVTLTFSEEVKESFVVRVVNMNGHVVAQQTFNQSFKTTLSVPQAQAGIYTVQVVTNNWNEAKKVVL